MCCCAIHMVGNTHATCVAIATTNNGGQPMGVGAGARAFISGGSFTNCGGYSAGGGLLSDAADVVLTDGVLFSRCSTHLSGASGGAIALQGGARLWTIGANSTLAWMTTGHTLWPIDKSRSKWSDAAWFVSCSVPQHMLNGGGALSIVASKAYLQHVTFRACSSSFGGAISATANAQVMLLASSLHHCQAHQSGGHFHVDSSSLTVTSSVVRYGLSSGDGGVLNATRGSEVTFIDSDVQNSQAALSGGCFSLSVGSKLTLENSAVARCLCMRHGGAISSQDSTVTLTRTNISFSRATTGGAVWVLGADSTVPARLIASKTKVTSTVAWDGGDGRTETLRPPVACRRDSIVCGSLGGDCTAPYDEQRVCRHSLFNEVNEASSATGCTRLDGESCEYECCPTSNIPWLSSALATAPYKALGLPILSGLRSSGGAVVLAGTNVIADIVDSAIANSSAGSKGGALLLVGPNVLATIEQCTFSDNRALNAPSVAVGKGSRIVVRDTVYRFDAISRWAAQEQLQLLEMARGMESSSGDTLAEFTFIEYSDRYCSNEVRRGTTQDFPSSYHSGCYSDTSAAEPISFRGSYCHLWTKSFVRYAHPGSTDCSGSGYYSELRADGTCFVPQGYNGSFQYFCRDMNERRCTDSCPYALDGVCDDSGFAGISVSYCDYGTDCSDCGERNTQPSPPPPPLLPPIPPHSPSVTVLCSNECSWAYNHYCDDEGSCAYGSDCADCGERLVFSSPNPPPLPPSMPPMLPSPPQSPPAPPLLPSSPWAPPLPPAQPVCLDTDLGFGGALTARYGLVDESCYGFLSWGSIHQQEVNAFLAMGSSISDACNRPLLLTSVLFATQVQLSWTPPAGVTFEDVCSLTCSIAGAGPCASPPCEDASLGFEGALASIGISDESCGSFLPASASSLHSTLDAVCGNTLSDFVAGLQVATGVSWTPPTDATFVSEVCLATCALVGKGPCAPASPPSSPIPPSPPPLPPLPPMMPPPECSDGDLGFNGELIAFYGSQDTSLEECPSLLAGLALATSMSLGVACSMRLSDYAAGLRGTTTVVWNHPAGASTFSDVCRATCGAAGTGPCAQLQTSSRGRRLREAQAEITPQHAQHNVWGACYTEHCEDAYRGDCYAAPSNAIDKMVKPSPPFLSARNCSVAFALHQRLCWLVCGRGRLAPLTTWQYQPKATRWTVYSCAALCPSQRTSRWSATTAAQSTPSTALVRSARDAPNACVRPKRPAQARSAAAS